MIGALAVVSLLLLIFWHNHLIGSILLGMDAVFLDLCWQVWRTKLLAKKEKAFFIAIVGGFLMRIISVALFLKIGWDYFRDYFFVTALILMTIPVWNLLSLMLDKRMGKRKNA
jgi:hypothetical protein